jgi:hypothetical protein
MTANQGTPMPADHAPASAEFHATHLAFARVGIVKAAAEGRSILDALKAYTDDVAQAERDRCRLGEPEKSWC